MNLLLSNVGLSHIAGHISSYLDAKSLGQCRLVSHAWKELVDNHRQWLVFQLEHINIKKNKFMVQTMKSGKVKKKGEYGTIMKKFPEWSAFMEQFSRKQTIPKVKELVRHMWIYFEDDQKFAITNPFNAAAANSNIEFIQLLIDTGIDTGMKSPEGSLPLHFACQSGTIEAVELLLKHTTTADALSTIIFHFAAENPDWKVLKLVLDTFKYDHTRNKYGEYMFRVANLIEAETQYRRNWRYWRMRALEAEQAKQAESQPERVAQADARAQRAAARAARRAKLFD